VRACVRACVRAGACAFRKNGACVRASRLCKPKSYPLLVSGTLSNNGLNLMLEATIDMFMGERDQVFIGNQREQLQKEPAQVPFRRSRAR